MAWYLGLEKRIHPLKVFLGILDDMDENTADGQKRAIYHNINPKGELWTAVKEDWDRGKLR